MGKTAIDDILGNTKREGINSKQKGNSNERVAAKFLAEWTGSEFTRVPSSGGLRWKDSPNVCGDIVCTDINFIFPFEIETKHLQAVKLSPTLTNRSKVRTIWQQAAEDAKRAGRIPVLMLRINGMPKGEYWVFMHKKYVKAALDLVEMKEWEWIRASWPEADLRGVKSKYLKQVPYERFAQAIKML